MIYIGVSLTKEYPNTHQSMTWRKYEYASFNAHQNDPYDHPIFAY